MIRIVSEVSPLTSLNDKKSWNGMYSTALSLTPNPDVFKPRYFRKQQKKVLLTFFDDFPVNGKLFDIIGPATPETNIREFFFIFITVHIETNEDRNKNKRTDVYFVSYINKTLKNGEKSCEKN